MGVSSALLACLVLSATGPAAARIVPVAAQTRADVRCPFRVVNPGEVPHEPEFNAIAADGPADVWAVGTYITGQESVVYQNLADHWDGTAWTVFYPPNDPYSNSGLSGVAARAPNDAWAVGATAQPGYIDQTLIEHWDGSSWSIVSSPSVESTRYANALTSVVAFAPNVAFAAGSYFDADDEVSHTLIERWDGTKWSLMPTVDAGSTFFEAISGSGPNDVWAVGAARFKHDHDELLAVHWNGFVWRPISVPRPPGRFAIFEGVADLAPNDAWAVGESYVGDRYKTLTEHWNGATWSLVPSPNVANTSSNDLYAVSATSSGDVWAVGDSLSADQQTDDTLLLHWDGTRWRVHASPNPARLNELDAVAAVTPTDIWTVGSRGVSRSFIAHGCL